MDNNSIQNNSVSNIAESEEKINEIKLKAVEKLSHEAETVSGSNVPAIGIYHFLKLKIESEEDKEARFAKQVLLNHKALHKCFAYILDIYRERAKLARVNGENCVGIGADSDEIFSFAEEYYNLDDEELERKKAEEKAAAKARKEKEEKERKEKAAKQKEAKAKDKPKNKKAKSAPAPEQMSLI